MAFIHISSDPLKKLGRIVFSDNGEYKPAYNMPCYEVIDTSEYKSIDCLSWYLYQAYKGYTWHIDYYL